LPDDALGLLTLADGQVVTTTVSETTYAAAPQLGQNVTGPLDRDEIDAQNGVNLGECAKVGTGATVSIIEGYGFVLIGDGHSYNALTNAYVDVDTGESVQPPSGTLEFKRNRTSANEFILSGDEGVHESVAQTHVLRALASDASTYPYRDWKRVVVHR
jgi:hypothetical protein